MPQSKIRPNLTSLTFASVLATTVTAWGLGASSNGRDELRRADSAGSQQLDVGRMESNAERVPTRQEK